MLLDFARPAYFATVDTPATDMCAGTSASLAINYLNFKDTDPEYAEESLKYAKALYDFAVETHMEEKDAGATTPIATSLGYDGGFYTSSYDYDELSWAAVWLYYAFVEKDPSVKQAAYDEYIEAIIAVDEETTNDKGAHPYTGDRNTLLQLSLRRRLPRGHQHACSSTCPPSRYALSCSVRPRRKTGRS